MKKRYSIVAGLLVFLLIFNMGAFTLPVSAYNYYPNPNYQNPHEEQMDKESKKRDEEDNKNRMDKDRKDLEKDLDKGGNSLYSVDIPKGDAYNAAKAGTDLRTELSKLPQGATKVTLKLRNIKSISSIQIKDLQKIVDEENKDLSLELCLDTVIDKTICYRIRINASSIKTSSLLGGLDERRTSNLNDAFTKAFSNKIVAVALNHKESFGGKATIVVKLPDGVDADKMVVYSYDSEKNSYEQITTGNLRVDDGYAYFETSTGGDFILSEGRFAK